MQKLWLENIKISLRAIKSQLLRTILTVLIIGIGITALVGILTAIDSIKAAINKEFTNMGANTFTIRNRGSRVKMSGAKRKVYRNISYQEAQTFREEFDYPATVSVSAIGSFQATVKYASKKTDPNIQVFGSDENYLASSGYEVESGRNFTPQEIRQNSHSVIIGKELATRLFNNQSPIDKVITVSDGKYTVIGVLKEKGSSMGFGGDKICIIPLTNMRQYFSRPNMSYVINVLTTGPQHLDPTISEATGLFRVIRGVPLAEEANFETVRSDNLASILIENIQYVTIAATIIGIITLAGAAIALMNIMLVSVSERTREIGTRKALGATPKAIKTQFLAEAIVICQLGGIVGIVLGIGVGNITSLLFKSGFIVPWLWMLMGLIVCAITGVIAGYYPAMKASQLDPIEALRHE